MSGGHHHISIREIYHEHFQNRPSRERLFLSSVTFFVTFGIVRLITHAIRANLGPFHNVSAGGTHVHHLVWGILLLLLAGYLALQEMEKARIVNILVPILFGVGAALTLDEFALWFYLADVYWDKRGRDSVDAVILFGGVLSIGVWGGAFMREVGQHVWRRRVRRG